MIVKFSDVANGTQFVANGIEYIKTETVKISCCRSINAHAVGNEANTTFITPNADVEVAE